MLTRRAGDFPKEGDERMTQKQRILLQKEYFEDPKFKAISLVQFHDENKEKIKKAIEQDNQIQTIRKALEKGEKEMKGVALGLCKWKNEYLWYQGRIWIPEKEELTTTLINQHHDIPYASHGGTAKTTELISRKYYWPKISETIKQYIKNCDTCRSIKAVWHVPYRLLQPNQAPDKPLKSIAMDFITDLPIPNGHDAILVAIDRLTKMSHFIPCRKDLKTNQFGDLFLKEIVRLYGIPPDIITDRGRIFTSDR